MRVRGTVSVENEDAVMFYETAEMKEIDQDGGCANEDMRES